MTDKTATATRRRPYGAVRDMILSHLPVAPEPPITVDLLRRKITEGGGNSPKNLHTPLAELMGRGVVESVGARGGPGSRGVATVGYRRRAPGAQMQTDDKPTASPRTPRVTPPGVVRPAQRALPGNWDRHALLLDLLADNPGAIQTNPGVVPWLRDLASLLRGL